MKSIIKSTLCFSLITLFISSCGSGSSSTANSNYTAPIGPNSYPALHTMFNRPHILDQHEHATQASSTNACGISDGDAATGLAITTGFISLVPIAGPALGALTGGASSVLALEGGSAANSCVQSEFNLINQQLAIQEAQIQNIESALNLSNNTFYQTTYQNASQIVAADDLTFQDAVSNFSGQANNLADQGTLTNLMIDIGFWDSSSNAVAIPGNLAQYMESNPSWLGSRYIPGVERSGNQTEYQSNLVSMAGVTISSSCIENENNQPYTCVGPNTSTSQIVMYSALYNALTESISNQQYNNYIPLYDNYNETLMQAYQQSIFALQQAYFMEYLNNQVNYNNAISCIGQSSSCLQQTSSYGNVPGTYFVVGEGAVTISSESSVYIVAYNSAQQQLTLLFAAYMNQAYLNTLNYIVTDTVVGAQAYPTGSDIFIVNGEEVVDTNPVNYAVSLSQNVIKPMDYLINNIVTSSNAGAPGYKNTLATSLQNLYDKSSIMLYQYYGLNNTRVWGQSVFSANSSNLAESLGVIAANYESAPQIFLNGSNSFAQFNQAVVPGYLATPTGYPQGLNYQTTNQSLMPYYAASGSYPVVSGSLENNINLSACNPDPVGSIPGYNLYWYVPNGADGTFSLGTNGIPYLMCGNWQTGYYQSDVSGSINNNLVSYTGSDENFGYLAAHLLTYANLAGNAWNTVVFSNLPNASGRPITYMASFDPNNFGSSWYNGNTLIAGQSYNSIAVGGFGNATEKDNYVTVAAAVQTTFPDGFIASFGINPVQNSNVYDTNTLGISYNPNIDIVEINGQSLNSENARWNYPGNTDGAPYNWAAALLNVTLTSPSHSTPNNTYMSALLLNGNFLFVNGAPMTAVSFNGYVYTGNSYLSLNPSSYTGPNMPNPYGIPAAPDSTCDWQLQNFSGGYEMTSFVCQLSSYW